MVEFSGVGQNFPKLEQIVNKIKKTTRQYILQFGDVRSIHYLDNFHRSGC